MSSFTDLGVPRTLVAVLAGLGITDPFPIQAATLPDSLAGRDVLGRGRTGSGKTYAFALPAHRAARDARAR
jgi:superfamily II DNA/RNA helicase